MNFAVGGSGVTYGNGDVTLGSQVDNFELFLRTDPYSKDALANSLTFVSVVGNDYLNFKGTTSVVSLQLSVSNFLSSSLILALLKSRRYSKS